MYDVCFITLFFFLPFPLFPSFFHEVLVQILPCFSIWTKITPPQGGGDGQKIYPCVLVIDLFFYFVFFTSSCSQDTLIITTLKLGFPIYFSKFLERGWTTLSHFFLFYGVLWTFNDIKWSRVSHFMIRTNFWNLSPKNIAFHLRTCGHSKVILMSVT